MSAGRPSRSSYARSTNRWSGPSEASARSSTARSRPVSRSSRHAVTTRRNSWDVSSRWTSAASSAARKPRSSSRSSTGFTSRPRMMRNASPMIRASSTRSAGRSSNAAGASGAAAVPARRRPSRSSRSEMARNTMRGLDSTSSGESRTPRTVSYVRFHAKITRSVRILMIAPEPFFEPRGTPFSEFHRIRALTDLGHEVDLVTYPFGHDVVMPGLRVFRCLRPPFLRGVAVGPSFAKIPLDAALTLTTLRRALAGRYDAVHSHEEGGLIGTVLAALLRVPHLYDMHSSLPQQLGNFAFSRSTIVHRIFLSIERFMIRRSRVTIVICPSLEETVRAIDSHAQVILIENAPGSVDGEATAEQVAARRAAHGFSASVPIVVYT